MDRTEFIDLLADYIAATETYVAEAAKTFALLGKCTDRPLSFDERFALFSQEIMESNAFRNYVAAKRSLHSAALLGYEALTVN